MSIEPPTTSAAQAILAVVRKRTVTLTPGAVVGAGVYLHTGRLWHALVLACLAGPPTRAMQRVIAEWIELLRPPSCWRRPRRRGS